MFELIILSPKIKKNAVKMVKICYVCNKSINAWRQNLTKLKLIYSECSISALLKNFLGDFQSNRNIDNISNCICEKCYDQIKVYDWFRIAANEKENELRCLFMKTEKLFNLAENNEQQIAIDEVNGNEDEINNDISSHSDDEIELISVVDDEEEDVEDFKILEVEMDDSEKDQLPVEEIKKEIDSDQEQENEVEACAEVENNIFIKKEIENEDDSIENNFNIVGTNECEMDGSGESHKAPIKLKSLVKTESNDQNSINDESETQNVDINMAEQTFSVEHISFLADGNEGSKVRINRLKRTFDVYRRCNICNNGLLYNEFELRVIISFLAKCHSNLLTDFTLS